MLGILPLHTLTEGAYTPDAATLPPESVILHSDGHRCEAFSCYTLTEGAYTPDDATLPPELFYV